MSFTINIDVEKFSKDIASFQEKFDQAARDSVLQMSKEIMFDIIRKTVGPAPLPTVQFYKRTGTWAGGWYAAANMLGLTIPVTDKTPAGPRWGRPHPLVESEEEVSFTAENDVRYAAAIEEAGTYAPEDWGSRRPDDEGYKYVLTTIESEETELRFREIIKENWDKIVI